MKNKFGEGYTQEDAESYGLDNYSINNKVVDEECQLSSELHVKKGFSTNFKLPRKQKKRLKRAFGPKAYKLWKRNKGGSNFVGRMIWLNASNSSRTREEYRELYYAGLEIDLTPPKKKTTVRRKVQKRGRIDIPDYIQNSFKKQKEEKDGL